jgi:hypothetical protein
LRMGDILALTQHPNKETMALCGETLPQARPADAKPSEIIVSLRIKLELLPIFQCIYTRLPDLRGSTNQLGIPRTICIIS